MKTKFTLLSFMLAFIGLSINLNAQTLFKDLNPGAGHADPIQFMSVNNTMYFITFSRHPTYIYQLWKSDGTAANTVMVKDNIIGGAIKDMVMMRANMNGTLYYTVNAAGQSAGGPTMLWKTDGATPVLIGTFPYIPIKNPTVFTVIGNKLFFNMGSTLYVSDGTEAGTKSLWTVPQGMMVAFNGKLYFQGTTSLGIYELYSSDGTAAGTTLVKAGVYNPINMIVNNNELYFSAGHSNDELWKTDGTANGTVNIASCEFGYAYIFNNLLFFSSGANLWKSDGTTTGTVLVKSAVGQIRGGNSNSFYTSQVKALPPPDYMGFDYWVSNGTTDGTVQISTKLGNATSFVVLNNKMFNTYGVTGLWETDGTEEGTKNIITGSTGIPFVFNNTVFFSRYELATGIELWSFTPGGATKINEEFNSVHKIKIYPNPAYGIVKLEWSGNKDASLKVFNLLGQEVIQQQISKEIDFSNQPKGIYILKIQEGAKTYTSKIVVQ